MSENNTQKVLLQIARAIALSDGTISDEEDRLLKDLPERLYLNETTPDYRPNQPQSLTELATLLTNHTDQCTAVRVACLVAGVSRNPGDESDINPKERSAYRELIAALQLSLIHISEPTRPY